MHQHAPMQSSGRSGQVNGIHSLFAEVKSWGVGVGVISYIWHSTDVRAE